VRKRYWTVVYCRLTVEAASAMELRTCAAGAGRPAEDAMAVNAGRNRTRDFSLHNNGKDQLG
jgi:hypothetical protein